MATVLTMTLDQRVHLLHSLEVWARTRQKEPLWKQIMKLVPTVNVPDSLICSSVILLIGLLFTETGIHPPVWMLNSTFPTWGYASLSKQLL